ncbi:hypothetical protein JTB14_011646 [Gonioctena quinquepunctata]|nr:hypothetical protein JTB14_011646 [Gonioctena quinquepunctata]
MVDENQCQNERHKKILLPTAADMNALEYFSRIGMKEECVTLKFYILHGKHGKTLQVILCLQLFNRKKLGELERILIEDYRNYQFLDVDAEVFKNLEEKMRSSGQKYARFFITRKLNRKNPVLISREHIDCIEHILE